MYLLIIVVAQENHKDRDCFAMAVLTHGDDRGILYGTDTVITVDSLLKPIKDCSTLAGKPKIFIFQVDRLFAFSVLQSLAVFMVIYYNSVLFGVHRST